MVGKSLSNVLLEMEPSPIYDTHLQYNTINHKYLESIPKVAFLGTLVNDWSLVECEDTRWFVETTRSFDAIPFLNGVSLPRVFPYKEPIFFSNEIEALNFAIEKILHLSLSQNNSK